MLFAALAKSIAEAWLTKFRYTYHTCFRIFSSLVACTCVPGCLSSTRHITSPRGTRKTLTHHKTHYHYYNEQRYFGRPLTITKFSAQCRIQQILVNIVVCHCNHSARVSLLDGDLDYPNIHLDFTFSCWSFGGDKQMSQSRKPDPSSRDDTKEQHCK